MSDEDLLPRSSQNQDQERDSHARLGAMVPSALFIFREETGGDFGTDRILELVQDGRATNFRVHVQGKSARGLTPNKDGSFSHEVPLKTIRYLRRQPCAIVFVYLVDQNQFVWAWISDVWKAMKSRQERLEARPSKKTKGKSNAKKKGKSRTGKSSKAPSDPTFSYRFVRRLDLAAFQEIHSRALDQGGIVERLSEVFALRGQDGQAIVSFATNEVTDVSEIAAFLRRHGYALASTGKNDLIDEAIAKLPGGARDDPGLRPILAFSKLLQGQTSEALSLAGSEPPDETPAQRQERTMVKATAEHALGITTTAEYAAALREARGCAADTVFALQVEIHELREAILQSGGDRLDELMPKVRRIVAQLERRTDAEESVRLSAQLVLWDLDAFEINRAEGHLLSWTVANKATRVEPAQAARMAASYAADKESVRRRRAAWLEQARTLRSRVSEQNNALFIARMDMSTSVAFTQRMTVLVGEPMTDDLTTAGNLERQLLASFECMKQAGSVEMAARLQMIRGDLLGVIGNAAGEREAYLAARQLARQIGFRWLEKRANEALEGKHTSASSRALHAAIRNSPPDESESAADSTPAERDRLAGLLVRTQNLPRERLPIVRKAVEIEHVMAREARSWCQHLGYLEGMDHRSSRATTYAKDPDRWCTCALLDHESQVPHPDIDVLLTAFKRAYCDSCPSREPAGGTPGFASQPGASAGSPS